LFSKDALKELGKILSQPKQIDYTIQEVIKHINDTIWQTISFLEEFYIYKETKTWKKPKIVKFTGDIKKQVNQWFENWLIKLKEDFEKQKDNEYPDYPFENIGVLVAHINSHRLYRDIIIDFYNSFLKNYKKYELNCPDWLEDSLYSAFNKLHQRLTGNPDSWLGDNKTPKKKNKMSKKEEKYITPDTIDKIKDSAIKFINSDRSKEKCKWIKNVVEYVAKDLKIDINTASRGVDKLIDKKILFKNHMDVVYADKEVFYKKYDYIYVPQSLEELIQLRKELDNKQNKKKTKKPTKKKYKNIKDYLKNGD